MLYKIDELFIVQVGQVCLFKKKKVGQVCERESECVVMEKEGGITKSKKAMDEKLDRFVIFQVHWGKI